MKAWPEEACALLLGTRSATGIHIEGIAFSENTTVGDPRTSFEIDPALYIKLQKASRQGGPSVVGVWHSHPGGKAAPSEADRAQSVEPEWVWLISATDGKTVHTNAFQAGADNPHTLSPMTSD